MMARIMQSHYAKGGRNARKVKRQLLKVLYATDMPSVLTEIGFMSNAKELAYMNSEKGQNELARMLCNAVKEYVNHINRMAGGVAEELPAEPVAPTQKQEQKQEQPAKTEQKEVVKEPAKVVEKPKEEPKKVEEKATVSEGYTIQVMASDKKLAVSDSRFKSYKGKVKCYVGAGVLKYKFCYGEYPTRSEAQRNLATIRRTFSDAFVVHYSDGKIVK
jgi:N-acetylmuramoyl-L-alanine amidase